MNILKLLLLKRKKKKMDIQNLKLEIELEEREFWISILENPSHWIHNIPECNTMEEKYEFFINRLNVRKHWISRLGTKSTIIRYIDKIFDTDDVIILQQITDFFTENLKCECILDIESFYITIRGRFKREQIQEIIDIYINSNVENFVMNDSLI